MHIADFIPSVDPYEIETVVELRQESDRVHMLISFEAMHDEEWTKRSVMGWEGQVAKLDGVVARQVRS